VDAPTGVVDGPLFSLDVLPGRSSIDARVEFHPDGEVYVRFRAVKLRRGLRRRRNSEWSGWFRYEGEPIVLHWETFW
jgi:hypothetical protein